MRRLRVLASAAVVAAGAYFALTGAWPWPRLHVAPPIIVSQALVESTDTLRPGETLSELFARQRVSGIDLRGTPLDPRRLRAGLAFNFLRALPDTVPSAVTVRTSPEQRLRFTRAAEGWAVATEAIAWTPEVVRIEGPIDYSLYLALDQQLSDATLPPGERQRLAWNLADDIFAWTVDFTRDIREGDRFQVVFEREVSAEGETRFGRILAADLTITGRSLSAYRFDGADGTSGYFDAQGISLKRAFLRAPVDFRRISSSFSSARRHPVLGVVRRHQGTDYAASTGTPVKAAGDGVVVRAERAGGYGNMVELRHKNGITTRYAHLSRFSSAARSGRRVQQGEIIGYVGATGLVTAPHLHYEFRVHGVARDARRIDMGNGDPVARADRPAFDSTRRHLDALLYPVGGQQLAQSGG